MKKFRVMLGGSLGGRGKGKRVGRGWIFWGEMLVKGWRRCSMLLGRFWVGRDNSKIGKLSS